MSHSHEDRVADRPGHLCAAYGCPLLGTMTASTSGTNEWWCFAHFGRDIGRVQGITNEIRRLDWLSDAITDVRMRSIHPDYAKAFQRINHDFTQAKREDLMWIGSESEEQWMVRLEQELAVLLSQVVTKAPRQAPLVTEQPRETFTRVSFEVPA